MTGCVVRASWPSERRWRRPPRSKDERTVPQSANDGRRLPPPLSARVNPKPQPFLARGAAEAEAREKNAEAFQHYNEAAVLELLVGMLPDLVRSAAEPISGVDKLTVISTDGASNLTRSVASNVEQGLQIGSDLMGIDLRGLLAGARRNPTTTPDAAPSADPTSKSS